MSGAAAEPATLGMVTRGVAVAGVKGGVGTTMVTLLAAFALETHRRDDQVTVLVDVGGDIAVALGIEQGAGICEIADGVPIDEVLMELVENPHDDPEPMWELPVLLRQGERRPSLGEVDDAVSQIRSLGWLPVVDCGSHERGALMVADLAERWLLSRLMCLVPTVAAAEARWAFSEADAAVLVAVNEGILDIEDFAVDAEVHTVLPFIEDLDGWQHERRTHHEFAAARDGRGDPQAAAAISAVAALLEIPHS